MRRARGLLGPAERDGGTPYKRFAAGKTLGRRNSFPPSSLQSGAPARQGRVGNHAENEYNNRCDELAVTESQKYK